VGLATAYILSQSGLEIQILEKEERPGEPWRRRHENLHVNTHRARTQLPGLPFPRGTRSFPHKNVLADYLVAYAEHHGLPLETGVEVQTIDFVDGRWQVKTDKGTRTASHVIVATGRDRFPWMPQWKGAEGFTGRIVHSYHFGRAKDYVGRKVLVIGSGNSGFDVLNHLSRVETGDVWLAMRGGPSLLPKRYMGVAVQRMSFLFARFPDKVVDRVIGLVGRLAFGDLSRYGIPRDDVGAATRLKTLGAATSMDDGAIAAIKKGRITVVPAFDHFDGPRAVLADGRCLEPDVVICATGYRAGLDTMVGHLSVLDHHGFPRFSGAEQMPGKPGLWFVGMQPTVTGFFYEATRQARQIARKIRKGGGRG
jgi:cation diffusion facilitator CzcD-associated flavoprotein CzcO